MTACARDDDAVKCSVLILFPLRGGKSKNTDRGRLALRKLQSEVN